MGMKIVGEDGCEGTPPHSFCPIDIPTCQPPPGSAIAFLPYLILYKCFVKRDNNNMRW